MSLKRTHLDGLFSVHQGDELIGMQPYARTLPVRVFRTVVDGAERGFAQTGDDQFVRYCGRCGATGQTGHLNVAGGRCFDCNGGGLMGALLTGPQMAATARRWAKDRVRAAAKRAAKAAARAAEHQVWRDANAGLVAWADSLVPTHVETAYDSMSLVFDTETEARAFGRTGWYLDSVTPFEGGKVRAEWLTDLEEFGFDGRVERMIETVRNGHALDARDTAYLAKVAANHSLPPRPSRHSGEPGDKVSITGVIRVAKDIEGTYGTSVFLVIEGTGADEGITWVSFSTAKSVWRAKSGDVITAAAKVKEHTERDGVAQDKVTHIKIEYTEAA